MSNWSKIIAFIGGLMTVMNGYAQDSSIIQRNFKRSFKEIVAMLDGKQPLSLKRAVFLVENAYLDDSLDYEGFCNVISGYKSLTLAFAKKNHLKNYRSADSAKETLNASLFRIFTDTIYDDNGKIISYPFRYNFQDALGQKEYGNVFVTRLLLTKKGTCRSMPYLYKILTEELGTKSYLALSPMHMYIKQRNKNVGWYNVELTSGQYPKDAYLIATGYISRENIISGLYMDTLSLSESIALCLMDLCHAYKIRMSNSTDLNFLLQCADKALAVKPNLIDALLVKQRTHKIFWKKAEQDQNMEQVAYHKAQYDLVNQQLMRWDYRDVPEKTFQKWYDSYQANKSRYDNTEINASFKPTR